MPRSFSQRQRHSSDGPQPILAPQTLSRHRGSRGQMLHQRRAAASMPRVLRRASSAATMIAMVVIVLAMLVASRFPVQAKPGVPFEGTVASAQVHVVLNLGDAALHPRQLAYDAPRHGIWFWTSKITGRGTTYANTLYFYDIAHQQVQSWPLYSGDWSSQMLAGLAVAPDGDVWIGWNANLLCFHPASGSYVRYVLPADPQYPLPAAVVGNLPTNLGIADLAVGHDGTVWIARYGALSLTAFSLGTATFSEYPLPQTTGDPARLTIAANGHILFTTDLAASHPGYGEETIGDYDPQSHSTVISAQEGRTLVAAPNGDTYVAVGHGEGLAKLAAGARASAEQAHVAPAFQQHVLPFDVDASAVAIDGQGRIWVAVAGQPDLARFDPANGTISEYQYAAPSIAAHPAENAPLGVVSTTPPPGAVWITPIAAMVCDSQGDLWYVRAGSSQIEEVTP